MPMEDQRAEQYENLPTDKKRSPSTEEGASQQHEHASQPVPIPPPGTNQHEQPSSAEQAHEELTREKKAQRYAERKQARKKEVAAQSDQGNHGAPEPKGSASQPHDQKGAPATAAGRKEAPENISDGSSINEQDVPTQAVRIKKPASRQPQSQPGSADSHAPTQIVRKDTDKMDGNGRHSSGREDGHGHRPAAQLAPDDGSRVPSNGAYTDTDAEKELVVLAAAPAAMAKAQVAAPASRLNGSKASAAINTSSVGSAAINSLAFRRRRKILLRHLSRKHLRQSRENTNEGFRRFWVTILSLLAAFATIFLTITGAGSYASYRFYTDTQTQFAPKITTLRDLLPQDNLKMYDSKGIQLMQLTDQGIHTSVPLDQISKLLVNATVATEDKNFWTNPGVDVLRIAQAALEDLRHGHVVEGGSTITQQLIKNLVVGNGSTIVRKLQEVVLTPEVNNHYSKSDIMEMYLNSIYYGEQAYGVDAAANIYFGLKDEPGRPASSQLNLAQAATLAGIPSSPSLYDPRVNKPAASQRMQVVLDLMLRGGYITHTQMEGAIQDFNKPDFLKTPTGLSNRAPHFTEFVLRQLEQQFHKTRGQLSLSGMNVYTTLDIALQDKVQKIMQDHIAALHDDHHISNAAEVIIDYHNGAVRSLLGSIDYNSKEIGGKFDVATLGYRQPGSSFKPYVYATAFEQGASPAQAIVDEPITINIPDSNPPTYSPVNYDHQFHGHMTIRCALQNSLNIPAVKTLEHVGIQNAVKTANAMGVVHTQGEPGYSMVLGGLDVNLLEHTSAYGTFANGGVHVPAYSIEKIVMSDTRQTFGHPANPGTRVLSPQIAYMVTDVLSDNDSRYMEFGPCSSLLLYSTTANQCYAGNKGDVRPAAAKTGTTNDFVDNWTMGYTTDYVMGVWAGNNDHSPMINISGVDGAAPIWHDSMLAAEEGHPIRNFQNPGGLEHRQVTYPDGVHTTDWFVPGTYPKFDGKRSATPTPIDGVTNTNPDNNNPDNGNRQQGPVNTKPYCTSFNYSFDPPGGKAKSNGAWW